jgi:Nuclease A inhibitor-like protein
MGSIDAVEKLKAASEGLNFSSESDYPFEVFIWPGLATDAPLTPEQLLDKTGHSQQTTIKSVELDSFFQRATQEQEWYGEAEKQKVAQYRNLLKVLHDNLNNLQVFRVGEIEIDVYILGQCDSDLIGLSTKIVET